jgi:hypothetical protein
MDPDMHESFSKLVMDGREPNLAQNNHSVRRWAGSNLNKLFRYVEID